MKIVFDIDGTLTDYYSFIRKEAVPFVIKKYKLNIVNPDALEIEEIFDIENQLMNSGYSRIEVEEKKKHILKKFWISHRFIKYILFSEFRLGVKECIRELKNNGVEIEIHTSRGLKNANAFVKIVSQLMTKIQLKLNGVRANGVYFYQSDEDKINSLLMSDADLYFDDKEQVINSLVNANKKVICICEKYNSTLAENKNSLLIKEFEWNSLYKKMGTLLGRNKLECMFREGKSKRFFNKLLWIPNIVLCKYNVQILNRKRIRTDYGDKGVIYAPNHVKTIDPIIIQSVLKTHIHWVALKRFFDGKDSVFNNSKNKLLCEITKIIFDKLELIPIERLSDNPDAINYSSLRAMDTFLQCGYSIGIFAEGTTRKEEGKEFGNFNNGFITLAYKTGAVVQPISIYWIDEKNAVVNIGQAFIVEKNERENAYLMFCDMQKGLLEESKNFIKAHNLRKHNKIVTNRK